MYKHLDFHLSGYIKYLRCCQVLVTKPDFQNEFTRRNLRSTLAELCKLKIIPIINANDAVAPPPEPDKDLAGVRIHFFLTFETTLFGGFFLFFYFLVELV